MAEVDLIREIDSVRAEIAEIYRAAFATTELAADDEHVRAFRDDTLPRHAARDGFKLAVARADGRLVGFGYGYTGERGQYWTDWLRSRIPASVADEWLGGHFELCEMCVLPEQQGRGIGARLHDALLDDLPHARALLTTQRGKTPASRLYRSRHWKDLCDVPDSPFVLLGRQLPD